jgi:hypothetical protein
VLCAYLWSKYIDFIVFSLTRPRLEPKIYLTRAEHASRYTTNSVCLPLMIDNNHYVQYLYVKFISMFLFLFNLCKYHNAVKLDNTSRGRNHIVVGVTCTLTISVCHHLIFSVRQSSVVMCTQYIIMSKIFVSYLCMWNYGGFPKFTIFLHWYNRPSWYNWNTMYC